MAGPATPAPSVIRPSELAPEEYPYSDGRVLMETDPHAHSIVAIRNQLQWHFERLGDIYVAGSMAVYYQEGDRTAVAAADVFVVWGVEKRSRKSYRIWDEGGVVPAFVVEVASLSASRRDATRKRATDEPMGAREYWRFERVPETGPAGWQRSEVLGLVLRPEEWLLRFCDPRLGRDLVTHPEASRALQESGR